MEPFVAQNSIVRRIWGTSDTVLFIFAGAAAEFALNKAVDWLYFTGRLPADPADAPVLLCSDPAAARDKIAATEVKALLLELAGLGGDGANGPGEGS